MAMGFMNGVLLCEMIFINALPQGACQIDFDRSDRDIT